MKKPADQMERHIKISRRREQDGHLELGITTQYGSPIGSPCEHTLLLRGDLAGSVAQIDICHFLCGPYPPGLQSGQISHLLRVVAGLRSG